MAFDKTKAVRAAEKYLAQNKIPAAIQEYRRIVEQDSDDFTALNTLGDLYVRIEKKQEAVVCFRRVAEHYREQGFRLKAIAMYKKITRFMPGDPAIALNLGTLYEQQGLMVEARTQYLTVAEAHARNGQMRESLEVLQRVADLDPNNTEIRLKLAEGFLRDQMPDRAADAFTEAGERLAAHGNYEHALEAYTRALDLRPRGHAALQGVVAAHTALGTADDAAEILEQAVANEPDDLELRAMLTRAYVEAEDALKAEDAADELLRRDPTSYTLLFDVARLYLNQNNVESAVGILERVVEQAVSSNADELLELLQEVLARDPEQMTALRLLARIYTWQRNEERLRGVLERMVDAAEGAGNAEEERRALAQLVRIAPLEAHYVDRLRSLGGALPGDEEMPAERGGAFQSNEVPTFESFMLPDEPHGVGGAPSSAADAADPSARDFGWEAAPKTEATDASASFADLNDDFTDASHAATKVDAGSTAGGGGFQEVDFGATLTGPAGDDSRAAATDDNRVSALLKQELESVDFYLAQGYNDIARDTLDMLARQYGATPDIEARRARIPSVDAAPAAPVAEEGAAATASAASETVEFSTDFSAGFTTYDLHARDDAPASTTQAGVDLDAAFAELPGAKGGAPDALPADASAGLDPGLAAIFDEFREAVEDVEPADEADYETHYNLGLAYKDMDLIDSAIESFQTAITVTAPGDGTARYLQCCNMLGHCFMKKEMPQAATMWFKKGLDAPGHSEDEYQALRFELGTAYEQMGDLDRAINVFTEVYGIDVSYRGVSDKLRELQALKAVNRES